MKRATTLLVWGCCLLGLLAAASLARSGAQSPAGQPAEERASDETALRAMVVEFARAYNAGDAPALAALFAENAQVVTLAGNRIEGRAAIQQQFATAFAGDPGQTIEIKTESLRFLSPDAAIEEGTAKINGPASDAAGEPAEATRYTAAYVRRDGRWLHDSIHDYPLATGTSAEESAHEHLKVLEGLVGDWIDESDEAEVHTSCRWADGQAFLLRSFSMKVRGQEAMAGSQRIGYDPRLRQIRSWVFDSDGGFSDGLWSRDGDRWIIKSQGVLKDGRAATATNILTFVNRDTIRWGSIDRTLGGDALPDADEITLVRKPPAPRPARPDAIPAQAQPGRTQP